LVGVGSLDYKCGKLIGKIDFGSECDTSKLVELSFGIVHSGYRGKGIMKSLLSTLLEKIKNDGFEWAFAKIHKDNIASNKASMSNGLSVLCSYSKPVKKEDFIYLSSQSFFSEAGKEKAKSTLEKFKDSENIIVDYNILMKRI
jgi:GNAT superfamily N-acetyltransferase